jgi:hypothetical protein
VGALLLLLLLLLPADSGRAQEGIQTFYTYDSAGRVTRVDRVDGTGVVVRDEYRYDPAGNLLERRKTTGDEWHLAVKKPAKGGWVLLVSATGTVSGIGADTERGFYVITGTLVLEEKAVTGSLTLENADTGASLATFTLGKSKVKRKSGDPVKLVLKSPSTDASGALKAMGVPLEGSRLGFAGRFTSEKNKVKVGKKKKALGPVTFGPDSTGPCISGITEALSGRLIRDPKGKAYGSITHEGKTYAVAGRLKDDAKSVKAKTSKGASEKFSVKLKR